MGKDKRRKLMGGLRQCLRYRRANMPQNKFQYRRESGTNTGYYIGDIVENEGSIMIIVDVNNDSYTVIDSDGNERIVLSAECTHASLADREAWRAYTKYVQRKLLRKGNKPNAMCWVCGKRTHNDVHESYSSGDLLTPLVTCSDTCESLYFELQDIRRKALKKHL